MKYKQWIVVHEPPVAFQENSQSCQNVHLKTCCCQEQGESKLSVAFNKNVFFSNEQAFADVTVDNSQSKLNVKEVEF